MKEIVYETQGTCAKAIRVVVDDNNIIQQVTFFGGCNGNTNGISSLVKGMKAEDVIEKLQGTICGMKSTSCPDQLSKALKSVI